MSPPLRCAKLVRGAAARGKQPCSSRLRAHAALLRPARFTSDQKRSCAALYSAPSYGSYVATVAELVAELVVSAGCACLGLG